MLKSITYTEIRKPHLLMLVLLISFGTVCAVLFAPALPSIAAFFKVSNSSAQLTVTLYLLGYAIGQLPYGPLSNRWGRINALNMGIMCQIVGALLCIISYHFELFYVLLMGRFVMALGASVGLMMAFTLLNDFYAQQEARILSSKMMIAFATLPGLSIAMGGFLCNTFSWQSCFYFLLCYGVVMLVFIHAFLDEPPIKRIQTLSVKNVIQDFLKMLINPKVMLYAMLMGGCTAMIYIYNAMSPFIAIEELGLNEAQFGTLSILPPLGILLGSVACTYLNNRYTANIVISIGIVFAFMTGLIMWIGFKQYMSMFVLFMPMMFINGGLTLVLSNASVLSSSAAEDKANASSIMNFVNMSIGTLAVMLVQLMPQHWDALLPISLLVVLIVMSFVLVFARRVNSS